MHVWLYVCMVVCMYGCMYVWLYICMVVYMYGFMYVWLYVCMVVCSSLRASINKSVSSRIVIYVLMLRNMEQPVTFCVV